MEKFVPDYGAPSEFIPLEECVHGGVYKLYCRNLAYGIFNQKDNGFIGIRTKFGHQYLFTEYHHDTGPPYGTVKPIEFVEQSPFEGDDVVAQFFSETCFCDNEKIRKYLDSIKYKYSF
jgi:hypothetical protein